LTPRNILAGIFILSAVPLLLIELLPGWFNHITSPSSYLVFHNIAEFFSVMVSLSMFGVGWYTYDQSKDRHALLLSIAFLGIGIMDFMHALSYADMPAFITPNSSNKSTQFWIAVRLFQAVSFLASAYVYTDSPSRWLSKKILLPFALFVSLLVFTGIVFFPAHMPATFIVGVGLTPFKKFSEFLVILLLCAAAVAYWRRIARTGDRLLIYYFAAIVICIMSEIAFVNYTSVFDTYNVLGHIYKVAAFSLIYYGIYTASVKAPYVELAEMGDRLKRDVAERQMAEQALQQSEGKYRTLIQNIQAAVVVHGSRTEILTCNSLAEELLGLTKDQMLGKRAMDPAWHFFREDGTIMPLAEYPVSRVLALRQPLRSFIVGIHRPGMDDIWVLANADPLFDEKNDITQVIVTFVDLTERKRTEEELRATSEALREREKILSELSARLLKAHEEERKRIASELHDTIGACLAGIKYKIEGVLLKDSNTAEVATESLAPLLPVIREAVEECRRIQMDLRPPMLDDLGLLPTLSWFRKRFLAIYAGINVKLEEMVQESEIPESLKVVIYRIVQEAMNNIAKHSKANHVRIRLQKEDTSIELLVEDNGLGFDPENLPGVGRKWRGLGLTSMKERAELSGGAFRMESRKGKGTTIRASWTLGGKK